MGHGDCPSLHLSQGCPDSPLLPFSRRKKNGLGSLNWEGSQAWECSQLKEELLSGEASDEGRVPLSLRLPIYELKRRIPGVPVVSQQ